MQNIGYTPFIAGRDNFYYSVPLSYVKLNMDQDQFLNEIDFDEMDKYE